MYLIQLIGIIVIKITVLPYALYTRLPPFARSVARTVTWWNMRIRAKRLWNRLTKWQLLGIAIAAHYLGKYMLSLPTPDITSREIRLLYETFNPELTIEIAPVLFGRMMGIFLFVIGYLVAVGVVAWVVTVKVLLRYTEIEETPTIG